MKNNRVQSVDIRRLCIALLLATSLTLGSGLQPSAQAQVPQETPTMNQDRDLDDLDDDDDMDWGWIGLLGLIGLAGLRRPKYTERIPPTETTIPPPRR
jgi:MYXO-CTERM domain-containing protein